MVVRRPEQFTRHAALVDHLEITFWRFDLDLSRIKEPAEMIGEDVGQSRFLALKRNPIRNRQENCLASSCIGTLSGAIWLSCEHHHETIHLADHRPRNFEKFDRPARRANGFRERIETRVFRIKRDVEVRTVIRSALVHL